MNQGGPHVGGVGLAGLEPATLRLSSACSNQLSYRPVAAQSAWEGNCGGRLRIGQGTDAYFRTCGISAPPKRATQSGAIELRASGYDSAGQAISNFKSQISNCEAFFVREDPEPRYGYAARETLLPVLFVSRSFQG